jgi:hypothetical protein
MNLSQAKEVFALLQFSRFPPGLVAEWQLAERDSKDDFLIYVQTQEVLLKSRTVLARAAALKDARDQKTIIEQADPIGWLEDNVQIKHTLSPELLQVSMKGRNSAELAVLVNAVVMAYLDEAIKGEQREWLNLYSNLEIVINKTADELRDKQDMLRKLSDSLGLSTPSFIAPERQRRLADFEREATRLQLGMIAAKAKLAEMTGKNHPAEKGSPVTEGAKQGLEKEVRIFQQQMQSLEMAARELREEVQRSARPAFELEYRKLEVDVGLNEYKKLLATRDKLKVELQSKRQRVTVLQRAEP